jgi:hypothetical protein
MTIHLSACFIFKINGWFSIKPEKCGIHDKLSGACLSKPYIYIKLNEKFINFVKSSSQYVGKRDYVAHIVIITHINIIT